MTPIITWFTKTKKSNLIGINIWNQFFSASFIEGSGNPCKFFSNNLLFNNFWIPNDFYLICFIFVHKGSIGIMKTFAFYIRDNNFVNISATNHSLVRLSLNFTNHFCSQDNYMFLFFFFKTHQILLFTKELLNDFVIIQVYLSWYFKLFASGCVTDILGLWKRFLNN